MSNLVHGNQAIKIPANRLSKQEREQVLESKEVFVYSEMLNQCEERLNKFAFVKNIDILEYNALFNSQCSNYEKMYESAVRKQFKRKYYNDQKKEFYLPIGNNMYHPYNPYLQKYNGAYLKSYQEF